MDRRWLRLNRIRDSPWLRNSSGAATLHPSCSGTLVLAHFCAENRAHRPGIFALKIAHRPPGLCLCAL